MLLSPLVFPLLPTALIFLHGILSEAEGEQSKSAPQKTHAAQESVERASLNAEQVH